MRLNSMAPENARSETKTLAKPPVDLKKFLD
jgi:hypothetical protein